MTSASKPPRRIIPPERLVMAEQLYLAGVPDHRLRAALCKEFGVCLKTARSYLDKVRQKFATLETPSPEAVRARSEAMLLETYDLAKNEVKYVTFQDGVGPGTAKQTKAVPAANVSAMAACAWRLVEIHGAAKPRKIDVTSGGQPLVQFYLPAKRDLDSDDTPDERPGVAAE